MRQRGETLVPWSSRPIFVCSTFLDMQAERDHLRDDEDQRVFRKGKVVVVRNTSMTSGTETASESLNEP